jgi:hypothetical protein
MRILCPRVVLLILVREERGVGSSNIVLFNGERTVECASKILGTETPVVVVIKTQKRKIPYSQPDPVTVIV